MLGWGRLGGGNMICESEDDRIAVADYISDLTAELALMAAWADHIDLARIFEMARLEAERLCGRRQDAAPGGAPAEAINLQSPADQFAATNVILLASARAGQK